MGTHINHFGDELQKRVADYPDRLMHVQNLANTSSSTAIQLNENDPNTYSQLKSFKDCELTAREVMIRTAINAYEQLLEEINADDAALSSLITKPPEWVSEERLNSLQVSKNQLAQHKATIGIQIGLLGERLQNIVQLKGMIDEAMKQQRVASLLSVFERLNG